MAAAAGPRNRAGRAAGPRNRAGGAVARSAVAPQPAASARRAGASGGGDCRFRVQTAGMHRPGPRGRGGARTRHGSCCRPAPGSRAAPRRPRTTWRERPD